jgi:glycosyltransferase involved in cell wall biosynthesis
MKTLCVLESVSRADGGIFEAERALQCALAEREGVDVRVVGVRDEFTGADLEKWGALRPRVAALRGPAGFGYAPGLAGLLDADVDLAYAATLWKYPSWAVLNWQKKTRKPVVVAPHGSLDAWALNNSRWKKRVAAWLFKDEQLRRATCFRALCAAEADAIRAYGLRQRIEVVPNGVELPEKLTTIEQGGSCEKEQPKVGLKGEGAGATESKDTESTVGRRRLLFLGRIHPKKGLVGALRAWAEIQNSKSKTHNSKQWQFVIAGWDQGGHEGELKALCVELGLNVFSFQSSVFSEAEVGNLKTERALDMQGGLRPENGSSRRLTLPDVDVVFFGSAFGKEKEALLRSAEAFILPSFSEGLPMSVLEAWSYGLPVVMTPECNLPEGFASGAALEIRNSAVGFEGMRTLIEMTDQERAAMGLRGRRLVEERFTWSKVAAQMCRLYEEVLGR